MCNNIAKTGLTFLAVSFLILVTCLASFNSSEANANTDNIYSIAAGYGGGYYDTAKYISNYLTNETNIDLIIAETKGSIDNINMLESRYADLAIVQGNVLLQYYYRSPEPFRQFEVITPLYWEALQIYVKRKNGGNTTLHIADFVNMMRSKKIRLFPGDKGGGTYDLMYKLLLAFGVELDSYPKIIEGNYSDAINAFNSGKLDAIAVVDGFPNSLPGNLEGNYALVTIPDTELRFMLNKIPYLNKITIYESTYPWLGKNNVVTLGTPAVLVVRRDIRAGKTELIKTIKSGLLQLYEEIETATSPPFRKSAALLGFLNTPDGEQGVIKYLTEELQVSSVIRDSVLDSASVTNAIIMAILVTLFISVSYIKALRDIIQHFSVRFMHFLIAILVMVILLYTISNLVYWREEVFFDAYGIKSPLLDRGLGGFQTWLVIFLMTGYDDGVFPVTTFGRIATTAAAYVGWGSALAAAAFEVLLNVRKVKRLKGVQAMTMVGHIVICGWNDNVPRLVKKAISAQNEFLKNKRRNIVLIANNVQDKIDSHIWLRTAIGEGSVGYVKGDPSADGSLELANISAAHTVILVCEDKTNTADERTLLRALAISKYCRKISGNMSIDSIYMIAEINNPDLQDILRNADVNEVVCSSTISEDVLIASTYNHGISDALDKLLSYNEWNEFYLIDVDGSDYLIGKTYDEVLPNLRTIGVLLVGIKVVINDKNGVELVDHEELVTELSKIGLDRQVLTNPTSAVEKSYKIKSGDKLLVIATDESVVMDIQELQASVEVSA